MLAYIRGWYRCGARASSSRCDARRFRSGDPQPHRRRHQPRETLQAVLCRDQHKQRRTDVSAASSSIPGREAQVAHDVVTLAVVGDVHGQWEAEDDVALRHLAADCSLFVGDFGEEDVDLVQRLSDLEGRNYFILGNHDSWWTSTANSRRRAQAFRRKHKSKAKVGGLDDGSAVRQQLAVLGDAHVGFRSEALPELSLSIVGGRPFSNGSSQWTKHTTWFYAQLFGIRSLDTSAARVRDEITAQPEGHSVVLLAHSGPRGLGSRPYNICGKDWGGGPDTPRMAPRGDHGDADLRKALLGAAEMGRSPCLVVFGHMHHRLGVGGHRQMVALDPEHLPGTVFVNAATVPRIRSVEGEPEGDEATEGQGCGRRMRHFCLVTLNTQQNKVLQVQDVWVEVLDTASGACQVVERRVTYSLSSSPSPSPSPSPAVATAAAAHEENGDGDSNGDGDGCTDGHGDGAYGSRQEELNGAGDEIAIVYDAYADKYVQHAITSLQPRSANSQVAA